MAMITVAIPEPSDGDVAHERFVDFQLIDRLALEIAQTRMAGTAISPLVSGSNRHFPTAKLLRRRGLNAAGGAADEIVGSVKVKYRCSGEDP